MHNQKTLIKRVIERGPDGKPVFNFGIFESRAHGPRQLTGVVEGSYQDAVNMIRAGRTASGNTFKGFKKLKQS